MITVIKKALFIGAIPMVFFLLSSELAFSAENKLRSDSIVGEKQYPRKENDKVKNDNAETEKECEKRRNEEAKSRERWMEELAKDIF